MRQQSKAQVRKKKNRYDRQHYRDHKEVLDKRHAAYTREHVDHSSPQPLGPVPEPAEILCIGERCWREGKTFVSPDPERVRMCPDCEFHANGQAPARGRLVDLGVGAGVV